jgi:hypothetical protein
MCRNIKPLFNFEPDASDKEIYEASLQYVRKISGFHHPSKINEEAFNHAIDHIAETTKELIESLKTEAPKKDRDTERKKAHERALKRFGDN